MTSQLSDVANDQALDILMSILMASARAPNGLTKSDILNLLATYEQTELYELCQAAEYAEEPDTVVPEEVDPPDIGPPLDAD